MRNQKHWLLYLSIVVIITGVVAACSPAATPAPPTPVPPTAAPPTSLPATPTAAPTTAPTSVPTAAPTTAATAVPTTAATAAPTVEVARPSNPGGPGPALSLTGDLKAGEKVYVDNCQKCHGPQGAGGVANPGSDDGTIPPVNPIDETLVNPDLKTFAYNIDLFVEHGSTPSGPSPKQTMPAWGDDKKLTPQQIADVIAYVISLNAK